MKSSLRFFTIFHFLLLFLVFIFGCSQVEQKEIPSPTDIKAVWPTTANYTAPNIHDCFGPRLLPDGYDFHAGIDIKGATGDPIYAILSGDVVAVDIDTPGESHGNAITIKHNSGQYTSYLHLNSIEVSLGSTVEIGQKIGEMGSTGASFVHLHFGYFKDLPSNNRNESYSRNPLEILTSESTYTPVITIGGKTVEVTLNNDEMKINRFELTGASNSNYIDYYEIVAQGSTARNTQLQNGIYINAGEVSSDIFTLSLTATFDVVSIKGKDFDGNVVF